MQPSLPDDIDTLWDYRKPEESEQKFRALLPLVDEPGDLALKIEILTQVARAEGLQRKFDAAHGTLDHAGRLLTPDLKRQRVRFLLERGRVFNSSGKKESSRSFFLEAWDLGRDAGEDALAVDAAHMMGIVEPPEVQIEWTEKALDLAEVSTQPKAKKWLASLTNNLGWSYHDLREYERALELFRKALIYRLEQGKEPEIRIARWSVARALRSLDRLEEALDMQRELLRAWARAGEKDGYVYEELAECLLALNRGDEAVPYFALAHEALSKDPWFVRNESARLKRLQELGSR